MKKHEIQTGGTYLAKVSDKVVPVRIDTESPYGGWNATNLLTNKKVRIKSAQRLRGPANHDGSPQGKAEVSVPSEAGKNTAKAKTKPDAKGTSDASAKAKKLSAIDAAVKVLGENGQPMTCKEMIDAMAAKGLWTSPGGKTSDRTLYAAITREIATKGSESRFRKVERGKFARA